MTEQLEPLFARSRTEYSFALEIIRCTDCVTALEMGRIYQ